MRHLLSALLLAVCLAPAARAGELVDGIAAQVGTDVVLISEVTRLANPMEARLREMGAPAPELAKMRADVLERLIERTLVSQMARRAEIDATEAELDAAIAAIARENGLAPEQLRASVEAQGLPFVAYRQRIREEIVQQKVLAGMVQPRIHLDEEEIRALYQTRYGEQRQGGEEVHLRHLLVTFTGNSPAARRSACEQVQQARERVRQGQSFEEVAAEVSEVNPERGGDLGWLHREELARWMEPVVAALELGAVSDVVETSFGCNLLRLVERREMRPVGYDEARPVLHSELYERRFAEEYTKFLEKLRGQTFIERKGIFSEAARLGAPAPLGAPEVPAGP